MANDVVHPCRRHLESMRPHRVGIRQVRQAGDFDGGRQKACYWYARFLLDAARARLTDRGQDLAIEGPLASCPMQQMGRTMVIVTQHAVSDPFILYFPRLSRDALCNATPSATPTSQTFARCGSRR